MPVPLTALFATAVHQVRSAIANPEELEESLDLLTRAASATSVLCEVDGDSLRVNGVPIPPTAPGAAYLARALREHHTSRLTLPAGLSRQQWREVAELYASAPDLYPTADHLRDAMRASVPEAVITSIPHDADGIDLREAIFELPGLRTASVPSDDSVVAPDPLVADRAERSAALDPLLDAAEAARAEGNFTALAGALLAMHQLEAQADNGRRALIVRERRRVAPPEVLDALVRLLPNAMTPAIVGRAAVTIGRDGAEALLRALNGAPGPHERRTYIDALTRAREGDEVALQALGSVRSELVQAAAEVIGRRHMAYAVPLLAQLLRHRDGEVRTAAWHALEQIGTREAFAAMQGNR